MPIKKVKKTTKAKSAPRKTKDSLQTPKGTKDILGEEYFSTQGFLEKASEIAMYYGFQPIETPIFEKEEIFNPVGEYSDIVQKEMYLLKTKGGDHLALRPEGTAPIMRAYIQHGMHAKPQPVMFYYGGPYFRYENPQRGRMREMRQFGLEMLGTDKSIADACVIKVLLTILDEAGLKDMTVHINSLGDKDCRTSYKRALTSYFKKHAGKLNAHEKDVLKYNPLRLLDSKNPALVEAKEEAPESIDYLTGPAKQHFKEVLEYLDSMDITYQMDSTLVRGLDYYSRTVFEIKSSKTNESDEENESANIEVAGGGRYDYLAKALGSKKEVPSVGGAIGISRLISLGYGSKLTPRILKKPKVYFIQLGFEAKLKSLTAIEILRKAKLPIRQSLSKDSLSQQLAMAERLQIPWVIILGQKEVLENTVIVRNMNDRSQKTVSIEKLADYIKKMIAK